MDALDLERLMVRPRRRCRLHISDCLSLTLYIIKEHLRWIQDPHTPPQPYTIGYISEHFKITPRRVSVRLSTMRSLIGMDENITNLYFAAIEQLARTHLVHFPRHMRHPLSNK